MVGLHRAGQGLRAIAAAMKAQGHELSHVTVQKILRAAEKKSMGAL
jgi:hypothetical protein